MEVGVAHEALGPGVTNHLLEDLHVHPAALHQPETLASGDEVERLHHVLDVLGERRGAHSTHNEDLTGCGLQDWSAELKNLRVPAHHKCKAMIAGTGRCA